MARFVCMFIAIFISVSSVYAEQKRQTCRQVMNSSGELPSVIQGYMDELNPSLIKACKEIDFDTEVYYALGEVKASNDVCHFKATKVDNDGYSIEESVEFMRMGSGACPAQDAEGYIPVDGVAITDFASISEFLAQSTGSNEKFSEIFGDQRSSPGFEALAQDIGRGRGVHVVRISYVPCPWIFCSDFDVLVTGGKNSKTYVLRMRRLWGWLSVRDLAENFN